MGNLKAIMQAGLQKDYNGVFNLNAQTIPEALNVDVVIDGDHYVESGKPNYQHGGVSNYEKHEGILPIDSTKSDWGGWTTRRYSNYPAKKAYTLTATASGTYSLQINVNNTWVTLKTGTASCNFSVPINSESQQKVTVTLKLE